MKKTTFISAFVFTLVMLMTVNINAQDFPGLDKSPLDIALFPKRSSDKLVKVVYSRPQLKDRALSSLAPNGKVWRTGANEATEITFYKDLTFGGKSIKAGTYSLFTIPGEKQWTLILSSDINVWGAYSYKEANDVARITSDVTEGKKSLEAFSITFTKEAMHLGWGKLRIAVPFSN